LQSNDRKFLRIKRGYPGFDALAGFASAIREVAFRLKIHQESTLSRQCSKEKGLEGLKTR
jgi:hypothetical protein